MHIQINLDLPDSVTMGEVEAVQGALVNASTMYVGWEALYCKDANAISNPGLVLLDIARQVGRANG